MASGIKGRRREGVVEEKGRKTVIAVGVDWEETPRERIKKGKG